ncbi:ATPase [Pseudomonas endophytica]|uniref:histidine kinase n=1 Tax=Pseudomonas endophytica TaxID=1563157 RepID=A0A0Q0XQF3_9PSED|nr:ATP-binding protein [Pseudomonas endophytica]KQB52226.1 ATPase [Pseudomonas endophytica]
MDTQSPLSLQKAIDNCAREPIRTPGSIQPQGFLLVVEETTMSILQASANVVDWIGIDAQSLIGSSFDALIKHGSEFVEQLSELDEDQLQAFHVGDATVLKGNNVGMSVAIMLHRNDGVLIAEFEPASDATVAHGRLYPMIRSFVSQMREDESIDQLCQRAVGFIKRITGYGRVNAYRFDDSGNGLVNAELADEGFDRYLGLCFPASDIPQQARDLYCANRIRIISDVNYVPSSLVPAENPKTGLPLDLSYATLRSVSPVHLHYMRNMGTGASMSVSIVINGKLWGLISCHNVLPRAVSFQSRTACELLGRVLSLQLETKVAHSRSQKMLILRKQIVQMLAAMADHDSVFKGIQSVKDIFLDFVGASGAAVVSDTECDLYGLTPNENQVRALTDWLEQREGSLVFSSDNVSRDIPHLPGLAKSVGGVLAVSISQLHSSYIVWFKPEQVHIMNWAGKPNKVVSDEGKLSPRQSFAMWQETVEGFSTRWDDSEIEGVSELRQAVLGIVLRKAEELAQMASELKQSNKELEAFSYSVSHDLRAPLRHIAGYAELLGDMEVDNLTERGQRFLDTIGESAKFAGTLVDNLLSFSQMGRSAMRLSEVNLSAMIESIKREMKPEYENRAIEWKVSELPVIIADPAFLHLALRNLVSNAIKYTRNEPVAVIQIEAVSTTDHVTVSIKDNGVGFDMKYADKLFGVFQRLHRMDEFEGTGIGLANVRRIVERHGGTVQAQGRLKEGATFSFSLPKRHLSPVS